MARPITFDTTTANNLYSLLKTDREISEILCVNKRAIAYWRKNAKLPRNAEAKLEPIIRKEKPKIRKRKTYKSVIEPHRIPDLESFLDALEHTWDASKREGVPITISECIEACRHR